MSWHAYTSYVCLFTQWQAWLVGASLLPSPFMLLCGRRKGLVTTVLWRCIFTDFIDVQSRYVWALGASTNAEFAYSALFCVTVGWQTREDFPGCLTWLLYIGDNCRRWRFVCGHCRTREILRVQCYQTYCQVKSQRNNKASEQTDFPKPLGNLRNVLPIVEKTNGSQLFLLQLDIWKPNIQEKA